MRFIRQLSFIRMLTGIRPRTYKANKTGMYGIYVTLLLLLSANGTIECLPEESRKDEPPEVDTYGRVRPRHGASTKGTNASSLRPPTAFEFRSLFDGSLRNVAIPKRAGCDVPWLRHIHV